MDYNQLFNISNKDREREIRHIIRDELKSINTEYSDYRGLCKYLANNIRVELNNNSIRNYLIDLNEYGLDHVFLIAEYNHDGIQRVLIDPSYGQFVSEDNNYEAKISYPSDENIKKYITQDLTTRGYIKIDDMIYSEYLSGLLKRKVNINLDEYLMHYNMDSQDKGRN